MSNFVTDIRVLDELIRELEKIDAKLQSGQIIYAWRDNRRVIARLQSIKKKTLEIAEREKPADEK